MLRARVLLGFCALLCLFSILIDEEAHAVTPLSGEVVSWEVAGWKMPCSFAEMYHGMCLLVRGEGESTWRAMPDVIKDFKHVWGHGYKVRVLVHTPNPSTIGEDERSTKEFLVGVDADVVVAPSTTFEVTLDTTLQALGWTPLYSVDPDFAGGQFSDGQRFVCADVEHCKTLHAATSRTMEALRTDTKTPSAYKATFVFPASPSIPLQLTALAPAP